MYIRSRSEEKDHTGRKGAPCQREYPKSLFGRGGALLVARMWRLTQEHEESGLWLRTRRHYELLSQGRGVRRI